MPSAQRLRNSLWALIEKSDLREYYNSLTGEATARKRSRDRDFWSICVSSTRNYLPRSTCSCIGTKKEHVALSWGCIHVALVDVCGKSRHNDCGLRPSGSKPVDRLSNR